MAKTSFFLDRRNAHSDSSLSTLHIAIRHAGTTAYISTGIRLRKDQWDGSHVVRHPYADDLNAKLLIDKNKIDYSLILVMERTGTPPANASELKKAILGIVHPERVKPKPELFYSRYVRFMEARNAQGTRDLYERALKKIVLYDPEISKKEMRTLDRKWVMGLGQSMEETCNKTTRSIMLRCVHAVFSEAIADAIIRTDPFKDVDLRSGLSPHRALSVEDLRRIRDTEVAPWQKPYRDVFMLLVYLQGINITDLITAKPGQLRDGRLDYIRKKTGKVYSVKIEPEAQTILDRYRGVDWLISPMDGCSNPKTYLQHMNRALKTLGTVYCTSDVPHGEVICPHLSTYWARHTWATLARELDISTDTIGEALGHNDTRHRITHLYIRPESKKVDEANRMVIDYINERG